MVLEKRVKRGLKYILVSMIFIIIVIFLAFISSNLKIQFFMYIAMLPSVPILPFLIIGYNDIYKSSSPRYRGLILVITGLITYIPSIYFMVTIRENTVILLNMYIIMFLTLIFVLPGIFSIFAGRKLKKISYYESVVLCTFFFSFIFLLLGITNWGWNFFFEKFWICLGGCFIISCMITGTVLFYYYVEKQQACFTFVLIIVFALISAPLVIFIFF